MSGTVVWITGLSGAGKTTTGHELYKRIKEHRDNVVMLDGDDLRWIFGGDLGYSLDDRKKSAFRNARISSALARQGLIVICCTISMFDEVRAWNRQENENYLEVYLKVPMEVLKQRNQKHLYDDKNSQAVGVGVAMEEPKHPDYVFINDGRYTSGQITDEILKGLEKYL